MVQVVGNEQIPLGVQLGLFLSALAIRRAIGEFHQALVGNPDALAAVMAGVAGFYRNTGIGCVADGHLGFACRLNLVRQHMAFLGFVDGRVAALVNALVTVGDVAGGATLAAVIAALLATLDRDVTALALLALVGKAGELRVFFDLVDARVRNLFQRGRKLVLVRRDHVFHVSLIGIGADARHRAVAILDGIVTPGHLVILYFGYAPGMQITLNFSGLGIPSAIFPSALRNPYGKRSARR